MKFSREGCRIIIEMEPNDAPDPEMYADYFLQGVLLGVANKDVPQVLEGIGYLVDTIKKINPERLDAMKKELREKWEITGPDDTL